MGIRCGVRQGETMHTVLAFLNHGDRTVDMEPLWKGILPFAVFIAGLYGLSLILS